MATVQKKPALAAAPVESEVSVAEAAFAPAPSAAPQVTATPAATLTELPAWMRAAAEKGVAETRSACARAKAASEEAAEALEASYAVARAGLVSINAKALESLTANVEANFDFVKSAVGVGGLADYVALQSEFARARFVAAADQAKTIGELAEKTARESLGSIQALVAKSFRLAS